MGEAAIVPKIIDELRLLKPTDVVVVGNEAMATDTKRMLASVRSDATSIRVVVMANQTHKRRLDGHKGVILVHPDAWPLMSRDVMAKLTGWGLFGIKPKTTGRPMPIVSN